MATKKKTPSKKGNLRDLPKSKRELPSDEAKAVKGGDAKPQPKTANPKGGLFEVQDYGFGSN
jgi:hypothetical protein